LKKKKKPNQCLARKVSVWFIADRFRRSVVPYCKDFVQMSQECGIILEDSLGHPISADQPFIVFDLGVQTGDSVSRSILTHQRLHPYERAILPSSGTFQVFVAA